MTTPGKWGGSQVSNPKYRNYFVYVLIAIAVVAIIIGVRNNSQPTQELKISELANKIIHGDPITSIDVVHNEVHVNYGTGTQPPTAHRHPTTTLQPQLYPYDVTPQHPANL